MTEIIWTFVVASIWAGALGYLAGYFLGQGSLRPKGREIFTVEWKRPGMDFWMADTLYFFSRADALGEIKWREEMTMSKGKEFKITKRFRLDPPVLSTEIL